MGRMNLARLQMIRESGQRREGGGGYPARNGYDHGGGRMTYEPPYGSPDMRGGYDDGSEMRRRYQTRSGYDDDMPMDRRMGFGEREGYDTGMRRRRRKDGTFMHYGGEHGGMEEPIRFGGMVAMEGGKRMGHQKMTREMAEEWVEGMEGSDPAKPHGAKWTMDQVKPIAQKYGVPTEGERFWEFWAVMNAMYSDYYPVAKKYNVLTVDYFADLAMAFINDKDAVENKTTMYYECIVEK